MTDLIQRLGKLPLEKRIELAHQLKADKSSPANTRLMAFVVASPGSKEDPSLLRIKLSNHLPEFMIPHRIVILDKLPQTPNGKIDHKALRALNPPASPSEVGHVEPANRTERELVNIWSEVLSLKKISVRDDFFDLGGDSILSMRIVAHARKAGLEFSPSLLFTHPTIHQLAQYLTESKSATSWSCLVPIKRSGNKAPLFLVHHGGGGIFGYAELARQLDPDRPIYGLQEPGLENGQKFPDSIEEIARLYVKEIRTIQPQGPYSIGGFCFGGVVAYEMAQNLARLGETVGLLILIDALAPIAPAPPDLNRRAALLYAGLAELSLPKKFTYILSRIIRRAKWEVERRYLDFRRMTERFVFDLMERFRHPIPAYLRQRRLLELNDNLRDKYMPQPYSGQTLLIRGTYHYLHHAPDFGWNVFIHPDITICALDTDDHLQMMTEPNLSKLVTFLRTALSRNQP